MAGTDGLLAWLTPGLLALLDCLAPGMAGVACLPWHYWRNRPLASLVLAWLTDTAGLADTPGLADLTGTASLAATAGLASVCSLAGAAGLAGTWLGLVFHISGEAWLGNRLKQYVT